MLQTKDEVQEILDTIKGGEPYVLHGSPSDMEDWWTIYHLVCGRHVMIMDNDDGSVIRQVDADTVSGYLEDMFWNDDSGLPISIVWDEYLRRYKVNFAIVTDYAKRRFLPIEASIS